MFICLTPWLEEAFATQLLLGHHWQQQRIEQKEAGIKLEKDAVWRGLYNDNGTCLDTTVDIEPDDKHFLYIIQLSPPIVCDSNHHIRAKFTPQCLAHLRIAYPDWELNQACLRTAIAVRTYSIRYTPYGPPSKRLLLILHTVDWYPQTTTDIRGFNPRSLKSLASEDIANATRRLEHLRTRSDYRRFEPDRSNTDPVFDTSDVVMAGTNDGYGDSQPLTQVPFGTQFGQPGRMQSAQTHTSIPIREDPPRAGQDSSRSVAATATDPKLASLLSLLNKSKESSKPATSGAAASGDGSANKGQPHQVPPLSTERPFTQLPVSVDREPLRQDAPGVQPAMQSPTITSIHYKEPKAASPEAPVSSLEHIGKVEPKQSRLQELASQCSWMKDFEFSRQTFKVDKKQMLVLQREESWHKPLPMKKFPDGNIPIEILTMIHRLADESAASGAAPDSDDSMEEDPSPESILETTEPTPQSPVRFSQVQPTPSSQVSWSPSPQPPQLPARVVHDLPPDSSFEPREDTTKHGQQQIDIDDIFETNEAGTAPHDEPHISSSPPAPLSVNSDDDMDLEMEAYIPQALGEDVSLPAQVPSILPPTFLSPAVKPVVQVKETPYPKKPPIHPLTQPAPSSEKTSYTRANKPYSSTSIIYGTYDDARSADPASTHRKISSTAPAPSYEGTATTTAAAYLTERQRAEHDHIMDQLSSRSSSPPRSLHSSPSASSVQPDMHNHRGSAHDPVTLQAQTKRKHENSPSKKSARHVKRRIKMVGFGSNEPSTIDPAVALRRDRDEALQKFREERKSSVAQDESRQSRLQSETRRDEIASTTASEPTSHSDGAYGMSPRHMSLYEDPPARHVISGAVLPSKPPQTPAVVKVNKVVDGNRSDQKTQNSRPPETMPDTVFATFRTTYPSYSGDAKHFFTQCSKIHALEIQDRMVPKWQWDDYIIRNRSTEWKDYALECLERGEEPPEYIRYYKDHIQDTLYRQSVVADKQTLLRALEELGVVLPEVLQSSNRQRQPNSETTQSARKKSRMSLPSAFDNHKRPVSHAMDTERKRPRVSLPASSHINATPSSKSRHAISDSPISRLLGKQPSNNPSSSSSKLSTHVNHSTKASPIVARKTIDESESTGDKFQDYLNAQKRMTSWTGSKEFDPKKPWPKNLAIRPSIDDMPKRKVDVLKWKDEL